MILTMMLALAAVAWLVARPGAWLRRRVHRALFPTQRRILPQRRERQRAAGSLRNTLPGHVRDKGFLERGPVAPLSLTVFVQQLSALLRGGRSQSQLWEELWLVHGGDAQQESGRGKSSTATRTIGSRKQPAGFPSQLTSGSMEVLLAARAATRLGSSAADAIRSAAERALPGDGSKERRIWGELAACFDVAEISGCPLADVLNRFAAQLEAEDDADAARRTALAGPKATVRLLGWLPLLGLGLGLVLGVDPFGILLGSPFGVAALLAGVLLTLAGKIWSTRLVKAAAGST